MDSPEIIEVNGQLLKLLTKRKSGIDTYVMCDEEGNELPYDRFTQYTNRRLIRRKTTAGDEPISSPTINNNDHHR